MEGERGIHGENGCWTVKPDCWAEQAVGGTSVE